MKIRYSISTMGTRIRGVRLTVPQSESRADVRLRDSRPPSNRSAGVTTINVINISNTAKVIASTKLCGSLPSARSA